MNWFARFKKCPYYTWVYLTGAVLTFVNGVWLKNVYLAQACLFVLYCILFYKGVHILIAYRRTKQRAYQSIEKSLFAKTYRTFRLRVLGFWLAFAALCVVAKFVLKLNHDYFYCCTYFFLLLDRLFINVRCLLRTFCDPKSKVVLCCCGCPCRGWDLLMIHTPLLFALQYQAVLENALIATSSIVAAVSMFCWEKAKYSVVVAKKKCAGPCNLSLCRENLHESRPVALFK